MSSKTQRNKRNIRKLYRAASRRSVSNPEIERSDFASWQETVEGLVSRNVTSAADITMRVETVDESNRSIEAVIATNNPVSVFDFERYEVVDEILVVEGMRATDQVPLLQNHRRWSLDDVFGSIRNIAANSQAGEVVGRLFFADASDDEEGRRIERTWGKVKAGHQREISAGYRALRAEYIPAGESRTINGRRYTADGRTLKVTTEWALREGSLVPIGADPSATTRNIDSISGVENVDKLREYLTSLGLRSDATDDQITRFVSALSESERSEALALATDEQRSFFGSDEPAPTPAPTPAPAPTPVDADSAVRAERERVAGIRSACGGQHGEIESNAIDQGWTVERTQSEVLTAIREAAPTGTQPVAIHSRSNDADLETMQAAMILRSGMELDDPAFNTRYARGVDGVPRFMMRSVNDDERQRPMENAHRFADLSMIDFCREAIRLSGGQVPTSRDDIIQRAFSTAELGSLFTTNISANVLSSYVETSDSTMGWVSEDDKPNFLSNEVISMGKFGRLKKRGPGADPDSLSIDATVESYKLAQYAGEFCVDEIDIINDRFGAMNTESPRDMGQAARQLRPDLVYAILLANANLQDGIALFNASHGNTQTGALAAATVEAYLSAMMKQRIKNRPLNIRGRYLIVPSDLEWTARQIITSAERRGTGETDGTKNVLMDAGLEVRLDDRIGAAGVIDPSDDSAQTGSATNFFIAAQPGASGAKTIEVGYLRGRGRSPRVTSAMSPNQLKMTWTVTMDIGAKAIDYRALQYSTGAS